MKGSINLNIKLINIVLVVIVYNYYTFMWESY